MDHISHAGRGEPGMSDMNRMAEQWDGAVTIPWPSERLLHLKQ